MSYRIYEPTQLQLERAHASGVVINLPPIERMADTLAPTRRDGNNYYTRKALAHLDAARLARRIYDGILRHAIRTYGDTTRTPISGIYADHFPESVKSTMRATLDDLNRETDAAVKSWRASGRRFDSLRPYLDAARTLPDGRVSYY